MVRLRALLRRSATDRELDEELRLHVERATQRNVARGMPEPQARAAAHREFGNHWLYDVAASDLATIGVAMLTLVS